ncbi:MAG TPA: diaminopimelate epimerase [Bacteroidia bacterium]|nr:diaminopimelate epimerase [Bacteroidia bacterium]
MILPFAKYHGTGNDFVLVDDRSKTFPADNAELIAHLCDRRFGIGGDGLMLLRKHATLDFEMVYFNADGKYGSMCGNGGRCISRFAADIGAVAKDHVHFMATDGPHEAIIGKNTIKLKMADVTEVEAGEGFFWLNTGSPHYVKFELNVPELDVYTKGRKIRYNDRFAKEGTNVNFVEAGPDGIFVRTYERGVEDETFSCGTGVTASALIASIIGVAGAGKSCKVRTKGGNLLVHFEKIGQGFKNIWLEGPAAFVFKGETSL